MKKVASLNLKLWKLKNVWYTANLYLWSGFIFSILNQDLFFILLCSKQNPIDETGCLSNRQFLLVTQASRYLIHSCCLTQLVRPHLVPYNSLRSTWAIYGTPCSSIGYQIIHTQPLLREAEDFPRGGKCPKHILCQHTCNQTVLVGRIYLSVRVCYAILYYSSACFESLFQIVLFVISYLFYQLGHKTF